MWGMQKVSYHPNRAFWRLSLVSETSCEFRSQPNCLARLYILSCSAPVVVTLQFPAYFTRVPLWRLASRKIQSWGSFVCTHLEFFFTLSHTQPLHNSHLNTRYLIAKIQENLTQNKTNTWLYKFNLTYTVLINLPN